jgi:hypothetical protein
MRKVLQYVAIDQVELGGYLTYRELAQLVYELGGGSPTKAQLSAVARAARKLEQDFMVEIYAEASDQRTKVVGLSPWVRFATIIPRDVVAPSSASWYSTLKVRVAALRTLVEIGAITFSVGEETVTPHERPLIVDTHRSTVT